ncbi:MAG: Ig-like domain-containing protein, partial [Ilumatobacteraceae bacterium]
MTIATITLASSNVRLRGEVALASGEAGNAAPSAVGDQVVLPAAGADVVLRAIDTDGDTLSFSVDSGSGVDVGTPSSVTCDSGADGSAVCTTVVAVTPTLSSGWFTFSVDDGAGPRAATVTVRNVGPSAVDADLVTTPVTTIVTLRGTDPEGDDLTFMVDSIFGGETTAPTLPSCSIGTDGASVCSATVEFTATSAFGSVAYSVRDGLTSSTATVSLRNPSPTAVGSQLSLEPGSTTVVLRGIDPNGDSLTFELGTPYGGTFGAMSGPDCGLRPDGAMLCSATVEFVPTQANASFGYSVSDGFSSGSATVSLVNPVPAAVSADLVTTPGTTTVVLRGIDPNGDGLTFELGTPYGGTFGAMSGPDCGLRPDGAMLCSATVEFVPSQANASFGYSVSDGFSSGSATNSLVNPAPRAISDAVSVAGGTTTATLRGVDSNGDALTFEVQSSSGADLGDPAPATCVFLDGGASLCTSTIQISPTTPSGWVTYAVSDGPSTHAASITFTDADNAGNSVPEATPVDAVVPAAGGTVTLLAADADGDTLSFELVGSPSGITLGAIGTPNCSTGADGASVCSASVVVTPVSSSGSFAYRVSDGPAISPTAYVTVRNGMPQAVSTAARLPATGGQVTLRGVDADGDTLTFEVVGTPSGVDIHSISVPICAANSDGSATCTAVVVATPTAASGSFAYQVSDGTSTSSAAYVQLSNARPEAAAGSAIVPARGATATLRGMDADGDALTFQIVGDPSGLVLGPVVDTQCVTIANGASSCTATVAMTPQAAANGSFAYRATDGLSDSSTAYYVFANAIPEAASADVVAPVGGTSVTLRGVDAEGDDLSFEIVSSSGVSLGDLPSPSCAPSSDGSSVCTFELGVVPIARSGSVAYRVSDGLSTSSAAYVGVDNSRPTAGHAEAVADTAGTPVVLRGTDADGDELAFEVVGGPSGATIGPIGDPMCTVTANGASQCRATVTVSSAAPSWSLAFIVSDGLGASSAAYVTGSNPTPVAGDVAVAVPSAATPITLRGVDPNGDTLTFEIIGQPFGATLGEIGPVTCTPRPDGSTVCTAAVQFTPGAADQWSFSYRASDGSSNSSVAYVNVVRATGADLPPTAVGRFLSLAAGPNTITLQGTDPEGADVTFSIDTAPAAGTLGAISTPVCGGGNCTATVSYTPDDPTVDDSFTYVANDGTLDSAPATVTMQGNDAPYPYASTQYFAGAPITFDLQAYDFEYDPVSFVIVSGPTNGTLTGPATPICANRVCIAEVTYTPDAGFDGTDSFTFSADDGLHPPVEAVVSLVGNQAPYAYNGYMKVTRPTTPLTLQGFDAELATLSFAIDTAPSNGSVTIDGPATCDGFGICTQNATYTPNPGFVGDDVFTFTVSDGPNTSDPAFYSLGGNEHPYLLSIEPVRVVQPATLTIVIVDPDGDDVTATITSSPTLGTVGTLSSPSCALQTDGSSSCTFTLDYDPHADAFGEENIELTVDDGVTGPWSVNVRFQVGNHAPDARTDILMTDPAATASVVVSANDRDLDGDAVSLDGFTDGAHGAVTCTEEFGSVTCSYAPAAGFEGLDQFTYRVIDSYGAAATGRVEVTVQPGGAGTAPTGCPTVASALDGSIVIGESWVECSSPTANGIVQALTPLLSPPVGGSALLMTSGDRDRSPAPSFGSASGRANGHPARGAFDVSVLRVELSIPISADCLRFDALFMSEEYPEYVGGAFNDAFLAELDATTWTLNGSVIDAPANFAFDPDRKELSVNSSFFDSGRVVEPPANGMEYDGSTQKLLVQTPITPGAHTLYLTIFDASDEVLDTAALIDNLRAVLAGPEGCAAGANQPPSIDDEAAATDEDVAIDLSLAATDADGDTLTAVVGLASNGSTQITGPITCVAGACTIPVRYTPAPDFNGTDSFTVTVTDGNGGVDTATVIVSVAPIADAPRATDVTAQTSEDTPVAITLVGSDPDGTPVTFALENPPGNGTVTCTGPECTYSPDPNFTGVDSFTYSVTSGGESATAIVTVTVTAANADPVAVDDGVSTDEDTPVEIVVLGNDSDPDGDT